MAGRSRRTFPLALRLSLALLGPSLLLPPTATEARAALLAPRPGPIDRPLAIAVADIDRDGYEDLIVANFQSGTLTLLINQQDGTFALGDGSPVLIGGASFSSPTTGPLSIAVADLNPEDVDSDGVPNDLDDCPNFPNPPDVSGGKQLDSGKCSGGSKDGLGCQTDTDCPGGACLANGVGDACEFLAKDTAGNVVGTLDSDGDGVPDYDPTTGALDNCPLTPNPLQEPETARGADGLCGTTDDVRTLYGPDGVCGTADDLVDPHVGQACAASPDLVILGNSFGNGSRFGIVGVRLNAGAGSFVGRFSKFSDAGASQILLADFTLDGRPDIVESNGESSDAFFFAGQADGIFSSQTVLTAGRGPQGIAAADLDGDGAPDLAVGNRTVGTISLYIDKAKALPVVSDATIPLEPRIRPTVLLAGRLDSDACADLVVLDQGGGSMCVGGTNAGTGCTVDDQCSGGTCSPGVCTTASTSPGAACASDADCPGGACDVGGTGDAQIEIFKGTACSGGPLLTAAQTIGLGPGTRPSGGLLSDLDGDAILDLAVTDFAGGQVLVYRGAGDGTFSTPPATTLPGLSSPAAIARIDYDRDGRPDLAVLEFAANRLDLYRNMGGLGFVRAPGSPASAWKDSTDLAMFGADSLVGIDTVLLHRSPPRLDVLSGIGNVFFRPTAPFDIAGSKAACSSGACAGGGRAGGACQSDTDCPGTADGMVVADVHQDGVPDVVVLDGSLSSVTTLQASRSGAFSETGTVAVGTGPARAVAGSLIRFDYDRDGVPDYLDDCPTTYNPPACPGDGSTNPLCRVVELCANAAQVPLDCVKKDLVTNQCDSDGNGVGDQCQLLSATCSPLDTDADTIPDYDPATNTLDNCPFFANATQKDSETAAGPDGLCATPDDYPPYYGTDGLCGTSDDLTDVGDHIGDFCPDQANNLITVSPSTGALTILDGDGTGSFHAAPYPPLAGFSRPTAVLAGGFSLDCQPLLNCRGKGTSDLLVAESGAAGSSDDRLAVLVGDGAGNFTPRTPVAAQGDPSQLLEAADQKVCNNLAFGSITTRPFDIDNLSPVVAALEPGTSSLGIYLVSDVGLIAPPGRPEPLPIASGSLSDAVFTDINQDGVQDLVAVSEGDGDPTTPDASVTIYLGVADGLFFTDPTFNVTGLAGNPTLLDAGNVNLDSDLFYPDVVLYDSADGAPYVLINIVKERVDIDGSGRVDGFDLAVLAHAFGAQRGEDFTILGPGSGPLLDGTLQQSGSSYARIVVGGAPESLGRDIPDAQNVCNRVQDKLTGAYGLPVDINLDGVVDGKDLALLASFFGRAF